MKIALVHDDFMQWGGAERMLKTISEIFPDAPIYTSMLDPEVVSKSKIDNSRFITSWLDRLPFKKKLNKIIFPIYPLIFEAMDFKNFDLVISSSTRFTHSVVTSPNTLHISYIHSPFRGFWETHSYFDQQPRGNIYKKILAPVLTYLRNWDYVAGQRPDYIYANSGVSKARVNKYYKRSAEILYPYVDLDRLKNEQAPLFELPDEYYVMVSRLVPWKRFELAVQAFNEMHKYLIVIGEGPYKEYLKGISGPTVHVVSEYLTDANVVYLLKRAKGLIHPQKEDFGITILEANGCGVPVVAFGVGGAKETVQSEKTGVLFMDQSKEAIIEAVHRREVLEFQPELLINNANNYTKEKFINSLNDIVNKYLPGQKNNVN